MINDPTKNTSMPKKVRNVDVHTLLMSLLLKIDRTAVGKKRHDSCLIFIVCLQTTDGKLSSEFTRRRI